MARGQGRYHNVGQDEADEAPSNLSLDTPEPQGADEALLPANPPEYNEADRPDILPMEFGVDNDEQLHSFSRFRQLKTRIEDSFIYPMKNNVVDPLVQLYEMASAKVDLYLSKLGNPLILRRFVYILFMSIIVYTVILSGLMPNSKSTATIGMFSDKNQLIYYASRSIDYAKLEEDMEYLSSMPHLAGTKGDYAITNYIKESFRNNGLKLMKEIAFQGYMNFPNQSELIVTSSADNKAQSFRLSKENFNPLSSNGNVEDANLIYANYGTKAEMQALKDAGLITENTILAMKYGSLPSEQILLAEKYGIKGIIFISKPFGDDGDVIQKLSAGIPQYGTGDALSPGWSSLLPKKIHLSDSKLIPHIPTIPISYNQGLKLKSLLSQNIGPNNIAFDDLWYSGNANEVKCTLKISNAEKIMHPSWNILGKIEGKEQSDKAIIIAASRDSACKGALYPNFGTASLMALLQLFQQTKYKYDWKPLRNVYFVSYDGSQYNNFGASELMETETNQLKGEVYTFLDISQLGVDPKAGKTLDIQATALLHSFFQDSKKFDVRVRNVEQYGDWTPYLANGIPTVVMGAPFVLKKDAPIATCADDFKNWSDMMKETEGSWDLVAETLTYVYEMTLRLIDEPLLPFNVKDYVMNMEHLFQDLQKQGGPQLDYSSMVQGLEDWKKIGNEWNVWVHTWNNIVMMEDEGVEPSLVSVHRWTWNKKLMNIMKRQCHPNGLPDRHFYKNVIFGPTLWTQEGGHDSWSFPGVRDAITEKNWDEAQKQINNVGNLLVSSAQSFMDETSNTF